MADFKSFNDLAKYIQKDINKVLAKEVAKVVKEEIQMAVDSEVYMSAPTEEDPRSYYRRGSRDGHYMGNPIGTGSLADINEMNSEVKGNSLIVTDDAEFSSGFGGVDTSKSLAENIEYGYSTKNEWFNEARPFMKKAKENIENNHSHTEAMVEGLIGLGYKVSKT